MRTEGALRLRMVSVFTTPIMPVFVTWIVSFAPTGSGLASNPRSRSSRAAVARARSRVPVQRRPRAVRQRARRRAPGSASSARFLSVVARRPAANV